MSWFKKLNLLSHKLLTKLVTYYDAGNHYSYDTTMGEWVVADSAGRIVIVSRRSYRTIERKEPITDVKALRKFLSRDPNSGYSQFVIGAKDGANRAVSQYIYKQAPSDLLIKPAFVIPETLLLANAGMTDGFYDVKTPNDRLFLSINNSALKSARAVGLSSSEPQARKVLGVSNNEIIKEVSSKDCSNLFLAGLLTTIRRYIADTFVNKAQPGEKVPYVKLASAVFGVLGIYLLASSGYLAYTETARNDALKELGGEVQVAMNLEASVKDKQQKIDNMQSLFKDMAAPVHLWQLFLFLSEQDVRLNNVSLAENGIELNVSAGSMTKLFDSLNQQTFVSNVQFTTSVRNNNGQETATLQLLLGGSSD